MQGDFNFYGPKINTSSKWDMICWNEGDEIHALDPSWKNFTQIVNNASRGFDIPIACGAGLYCLQGTSQILPIVGDVTSPQSMVN